MAYCYATLSIAETNRAVPELQISMPVWPTLASPAVTVSIVMIGHHLLLVTQRAGSVYATTIVAMPMMPDVAASVSYHQQCVCIPHIRPMFVTVRVVGPFFCTQIIVM
jgi:hypothetical protein